MGKSKVDMTSDMRNVIAGMRPLLIEAKVPDKNLIVEVGVEKYIRVDVIRKAYKWILKIFGDEYKEAKKNKNLLTQEQWDTYKLYGGFEDHEEVVLLKNSLTALRKAVVTRTRPDFFKKVFIDGCKRKNHTTK